MKEAKKDTVAKDTVRESLHMLQPSATDKENLVAAGRMLRSTKQIQKTKTENVTSEKTKSNSPDKSKKSKDKAIQTSQVSNKKVKTDIEEMTSTSAASEHYWERVADRQRVKLDNVYDENMALKDQIKKLNEQIDILREKNRVQEEMLKETRALVEVLQDMIEGDSNGIDNSLDDSAC